MAKPSQPREKKGTYGAPGLPVTKTYLMPKTRRPMILVGVLLAVLAGLYIALDVTVQDSHFVSNGPLSSAHAALENDCSSCHDPWNAVTAEKCSTCHEKHGDSLGVYTWTSHYVYRSNDFQQAVPSPHETACAACHSEHGGRDANITRTDDATCATCHEFPSFNDGHPNFEFAAKEIPDDHALMFPHTRHVRELMQREGLVDLEQACLYCHQARPDGKTFEPIRFDLHCDSCHLTTAIRTPSLPLEDASQAIGVVPFERFRDSEEPGNQWALFTSPREFRKRGQEISKSPVYHQDPWVLANLRRLRQKLYPDAGLADLLIASTDVPTTDLPELYEEAIATLETYALGLRGSDDPEVQRDLRDIEDQLKKLRRAVRDPYTPLDESKFTLALEGDEAELSEAERAEIDALIFDLTAVCQQCHLVEKATVARVQNDQRVLDRARFDHRAHILDLRCLDCHYQIPIEESLETLDENPYPPFDQAMTQNLPAIDTCQECHTPKLASNRCTTCHDFHPNKSRRSSMLLYLEED